MIPFNKPFFTGKEVNYISDAILNGKVAGDGYYTKKCQEFFETKYGFKKALLTTSCTDALEMAAILLDIQPGDEVIAPSYTFVSTVNAFVLRGAKIAFVDSCIDHPNIDPKQIAKLITPKTKAIVVVHYAGVACDMDVIIDLATQYNIPVVEDAAQAIDGYYKGRPLGSIGAFGTFSFHETKNIISGEGGLLAINDERYIKRAEIIREKGTNRSSFFRGEVAKYGWVDIGSSFLPSDIISAHLYAQLESLEYIQTRRKYIWERYYKKLENVPSCFGIKLPKVFDYSTNNAHMFYLVCNNLEQRTMLIKFLKDNGVHSVFHYLSLHKSEFYNDQYLGLELLNSDSFTDKLVRLPLFYDLKDEQVDYICSKINEFLEMQ
ncbi:dTDP-4-amino-4,6-dideoxygalactose transaminase [Vibrio parahaemolyticus]|uniref:dTDP-4-amino-4,6-dideoxygalactose transaminase n=1 Tax=Vibrio parahaemolyticus TaxID=670 RepID=UPI0009B6D21D|nr:dTDP-4-amino-4,6-dideoxygalactose transaminase [Vibrio parahaemolyticus]EHJ9992222.1 dTDP-4-amino-4,6-dideoxygalactose transaminase [Vibrio parahaemolyticus]MCG0008409.1 dTDP-4-amino-4,6-dideoxygalactose transaminase [Vibrio parahaemolyticus]MCG0013176.1 dTDP-4-amino-4,6-dideoxygalactose transaminase [Vibrio parahaemolyticus]MDL1999107.1 dTDP-4-amino-4,6-dideoxygalactose transaminase [Vibrio parahaemolyticus]MDL2021048.1 dTDP-4-amino-4,6-dideoxygalactose transaminase [Vibrio parahaemolyticu